MYYYIIFPIEKLDPPNTPQKKDKYEQTMGPKHQIFWGTNGKSRWVCLKIGCVPLLPQSGFADQIIPMKNGYFIGNIPHLQTESLKIVYPYTQWLMIIIPTKWLFHWGFKPNIFRHPQVLSVSSGRHLAGRGSGDALRGLLGPELQR